jgi:RecQ family ATP-dependent DNA helicase
MVVVRQDLSEGNTKLLYMAPESLNKTENIEFLRELKVSFYAIDEAHCISEWGHDFRPEYRMLRQAINAIGRRPILALTATATQKVMSDILKTLEIPKASTFMTSFNRANLTYEVEAKTANVERDVVKLLRNYMGRSAIIYCLSRQKVEELAQVLQLNGLSALPYHAGLDANSRIRHQDAFLNEEVDIIVATVAFGMGIDKPDVRLVVHHDMPRSLEGYYQETGRAGRDGGEGRCVTFYAEKDLDKMDKFLARKPVAEQEIGRQLLLDARAYAITSSCRRKFLLHYFGEEYAQANCGNCDNCQNPESGIDASEHAHLIVDTLALSGGQFRALQVVNTLIGLETSLLKTLGARSMATWGKGSSMAAAYWDDLIRQMMLAGLLQKDLERYGILPARNGLRSEAALPPYPFAPLTKTTKPEPQAEAFARARHWTRRSMTSSKTLTAKWPALGIFRPMRCFRRLRCTKWLLRTPSRWRNSKPFRGWAKPRQSGLGRSWQTSSSCTWRSMKSNGRVILPFAALGKKATLSSLLFNPSTESSGSKKLRAASRSVRTKFCRRWNTSCAAEPDCAWTT